MLKQLWADKGIVYESGSGMIVASSTRGEMAANNNRNRCFLQSANGWTK